MNTKKSARHTRKSLTVSVVVGLGLLLAREDLRMAVKRGRRVPAKRWSAKEVYRARAALAWLRAERLFYQRRGAL